MKHTQPMDPTNTNSENGVVSSSSFGVWIAASNAPEPSKEGVMADAYLCKTLDSETPKVLCFIYAEQMWTQDGDDTQRITHWLRWPSLPRARQERELNEAKAVVEVTKEHMEPEDEVYCSWYRCAACNNNWIVEGHNFCPGCGRKLVWKTGYQAAGEPG